MVEVAKNILDPNSRKGMILKWDNKTVQQSHGYS